MGKPAARLGDIGSEHIPFPPTPIVSGSSNVHTNSRPAARLGDSLIPHAAPSSPLHGRSIAAGASTVFINSKPAARVGDSINCGGNVSTGSGNVFIGDSPSINRPRVPKLSNIVFPGQRGSQAQHQPPESERPMLGKSDNVFIGDDLALMQTTEEKPEFALRFEAKDLLGNPVKGLPFRVVAKGLANDGKGHIADEVTASDGKTKVVSRNEADAYDYHFSWPRVSTTRAKKYAAGHAGRTARLRDEREAAFEERMQQMLANGHAGIGHELTYEEAKWWWKNANGKTLTVDGRELSVLDIGSEFATPWPLDNLKVHGHVTTNPVNGRIYDGMYDFEPRVMPNPNYSPKIAMRNYLNERAIAQHGSGNPFEIQYRYDDSFFP